VLSSRRRRLDECELTMPERQQDTNAVARLPAKHRQRYQSCHLQSASSAQHATSALSLTAGCQWPTTWRQSVAQHTITCRQIRPTLESLSRDAAKTLVQAFISSRLGYCNSVLYGVIDNLLQRLQSVQNATARLIAQTGRREHISPVLQELHWLPV